MKTGEVCNPNSGKEGYLQWVSVLWRELPFAEKQRYEEMAKQEQMAYTKHKALLSKVQWQ